MTTDPSGIITDVNKQMEALTGCTRDELIGAPFKNYFTDPERAEASIKQVLSQKKVANYELTARARYSISLSSNCGFRQTWKAHFRNWPQLFTASTQRFAAVCLAFVWSSSKPLISSTTVTPLLSRTRKSGS